MTSIPGASEIFDASIVTYSNKSKTTLLGVNTSLITEHGAVSAEVAKAMAEGGLAASNADVHIDNGYCRARW